ncbi:MULTISPECIES: hypothetical protein [Staphylococcus intermedius group]|uniref:Cytosolic protein n=1 Tax=Staphylococcus intermedius NCTC 11048 TaxID=1141106 RepID=A0A380G5I0_STAIN|nr:MULTISPECIES: hypothetical protein [Staphylococcus intermedius group]PCF64534.1 hypothetical protein B5C04_00360 [Staphylococcus intermedius]PCF80142.1 hypothetical protein B4W74_00365 [Staphylococcus intermedius]PCF81493.1 hypothetical protein B4W70_00360 [Staphylococcus intermedius]PCF83372.1 hypothetical protein B4W69_09555 [Staphylococcus delphini]PCF84641.1 hypothetical protein B4W76_11305 [Staphylococcus intermedius]
MKIISCIINKETVVYKVLTNDNHTFTYELPKDLSSQKVIEYLKIIEEKIDNDNKTGKILS